MTGKEKRALIDKAVRELVEAELNKCYASEYAGKDAWDKANARVKRADAAFKKACDEVFGVKSK